MVISCMRPTNPFSSRRVHADIPSKRGRTHCILCAPKGQCLFHTSHPRRPFLRHKSTDRFHRQLQILGDPDLVLAHGSFNPQLVVHESPVGYLSTNHGRADRGLPRYHPRGIPACWFLASHSWWLWLQCVCGDAPSVNNWKCCRTETFHDCLIATLSHEKTTCTLHQFTHAHSRSTWNSTKCFHLLIDGCDG